MELTRREFIKSALLLSGSLLLCDHPLSAGNTVDHPWIPAYAKLEKAGQLLGRVERAREIFAGCELCPRQCGVNRQRGETGFCRATDRLKVYAAHPHYGEELSLVGKRGSGTIFFSNCNLRCVFCQNWPISHKGYGTDIQDEDLADMMIHLQKIGCHNINLVTPTHVMPNILNATRIAHNRGLHLPLVYNTSGYERVEMLKLLDGIVDIYLPDMKFMDPDMAGRYAPGASDYPGIAQKAILEMHRQVGEHRVNSRGIATRGLMIRHLIMPNRVAGTEKFIRWVSEALTKSTYVNLMSQYHPDYEAFDHPKIWRRINMQEFLEAMEWADKYGLTNIDPRSVSMRKFYEQQPVNGYQ